MSNDAKPVILIVDDDPDLAMIMRMILTHAGFEAHACLSGQEALDWLAVRTPDLILLDLMMPDVNGFTILRKVRASERSKDLPIVILTAKADQKTRLESQSAGADAFLTKPINSKSLIEYVRRALGQKAPAATPPATEPPVQTLSN
ncbi:MAG: response regulator [Anaerolineales bacterium]|nr:response regulator [Anaerolineales bacterium]